MKKSILILSILLISITSFSQTNSKENSLVDTWVTEENKSNIQIVEKDGKFYGRIAWLKEPTYEDGTKKIDKNNPKEKHQADPLIGLWILKGFTYSGENKWEEGTVYDPENGKTYSCEINMTDKDTIEVRGYIGISLIGRTSVWKRK